MDLCTIPLLMVVAVASRPVCDLTKIPLELGVWKRYLERLDTATIENPPVTAKEGQIYVYDNYFPSHTIRYIHVDNLAIRSCGASATIKVGGINTSGVLIVLHSGAYHEIRSVIDIWGTKNSVVDKELNSPLRGHLKEAKSQYLFKGLRAVNHNLRNSTSSNYFKGV